MHLFPRATFKQVDVPKKDQKVRKLKKWAFLYIYYLLFRKTQRNHEKHFLHAMTM